MDDTQQTEIEQLKQQLEASKRLYEITLANEIRWMLKHEKATQELEAAWGIIANAGGGDWELESPEWQEAAKAWRGRHFANSTTSLHNESSTTGELLEPAAQLLEQEAERLEDIYRIAESEAVSLYHMARAPVQGLFRAEQFREAATWLRAKPYNLKLSESPKKNEYE